MLPAIAVALIATLGWTGTWRIAACAALLCLGIGWLLGFALSPRETSAPDAAAGRTRTWEKQGAGWIRAARGCSVGGSGRASAVSPIDRPNRFSIGTSLRLPFGRSEKFGKDWHRAIDAVLGGWQMSGTYQY